MLKRFLCILTAVALLAFIPSCSGKKTTSNGSEQVSGQSDTSRADVSGTANSGTGSQAASGSGAVVSGKTNTSGNTTASGATTGSRGTTVNTAGISGTVKYYTWADSATQQKYRAELTKTFYNKFPKVKIEFNTATGDYYQKLLTWMASNSEPDVFQMEPGEVLGFLKNKKLEPLDSYIGKTTSLSANDLWPINSTAYRYDGSTLGKGSLYVLIKDWSPDFMMLYNKKQYSDAGLRLPTIDNPYTWDELRNAVTKLTKRDASNRVTHYGWIMDNNTMKLYVQLMASNGSCWFDKSSGNITMTNSKTKQATQYFFDMLEATGTDNYGGGTSGGMLFANGTASTYFSGRYAIATYNYLNKMDLGIATPPVPNAGDKPKVLTTGLVGFAMSKNSRYKAAAGAFIEWCMTDLQQSQAAEGYNIPGNKTISDRLFANASDAKMKAVNNTFLSAANKYTEIIPINPYLQQADFEKRINNLAGGVTKSGKTIDSFTEDAQSTLQKVVNDNR